MTDGTNCLDNVSLGPEGEGEGEGAPIFCDSDGIDNVADNCLTTPNSDQLNSDTDALGDACDNCPAIDNQEQGDRTSTASATPATRVSTTR
jgi:hypothetical protein